MKTGIIETIAEKLLNDGERTRVEHAQISFDLKSVRDFLRKHLKKHRVRKIKGAIGPVIFRNMKRKKERNNGL